MDYFKIFKDTLDRSKKTKKSIIYFEKDFLNDSEKPKEQNNFLIEFKCEDVINVAEKEFDTFSNVCVLNFASELFPGGGVKKCRGSQEEEICRRTDLFKNIIKFENLYYFNILKNTSKDKKKLF